MWNTSEKLKVEQKNTKEYKTYSKSYSVSGELEKNLDNVGGAFNGR